MRYLLLFLSLLLFSCSDNTLNPNETENNQIARSSENNTPDHGSLPPPMIVGGDEVDPACPNCKYPFMVSLRYGGGHWCGGSLVRDNWVITAAHCVEGVSQNSLQVKIGLHNVNSTSGAITRNVDDILDRHKDLKEFEDELKKHKDDITPGQVGES